MARRDRYNAGKEHISIGQGTILILKIIQLVLNMNIGTEHGTTLVLNVDVSFEHG